MKKDLILKVLYIIAIVVAIVSVFFDYLGVLKMFSSVFFAVVVCALGYVWIIKKKT